MHFALTPLQLDRFQAVRIEHVLGHAQPRVLHVHLDEDLAQAAMIPAIGLDPPVHVGCRNDPAPIVQLQLRIDPADVFTTDERDAADRRSHGEVFPVATGDFRGA